MYVSFLLYYLLLFKMPVYGNYKLLILIYAGTSLVTIPYPRTSTTQTLFGFFRIRNVFINCFSLCQGLCHI